MSDNLPVPSGGELAAARQATAEFITASKAKATRAAYASDCRYFESWCRSHGLAFLPASPESVAAYLSAQVAAGRKVSTIRRRCVAIGQCQSRRQTAVFRGVWHHLRT
jgi:hypothetical protein